MLKKAETEEADARGDLNLDDLFYRPVIKAAQESYQKAVQLYPPDVGKRVSKRERDETDAKDANLAYGEVSFEVLATVITKIKEKLGKPSEGSSPPETGILQPSKQGDVSSIGFEEGVEKVRRKVMSKKARLRDIDICLWNFRGLIWLLLMPPPISLVASALVSSTTWAQERERLSLRLAPCTLLRAFPE